MITVTDYSEELILFTVDSVEKYAFKKYIKLYQDRPLLRVEYLEYVSDDASRKSVLTIDFHDVTSPVVTSAFELETEILAMIGDGPGTGVSSITGFNVDNTDPSNPVILPPIENGLLSSDSGRVTWLQDYDYEGSGSIYAIGGVQYTAPLTPMTLAAADATFDRLDTFVLNTSGAWEVLTGTPSANPLEPEIDVTTQLRVAFALVQANTTAPTLPTEDIYLENAEWTTAASAGTINPDSASNPYAGTKDIEGTTVANGQNITFTPTLFPSLILLDSFVFKIRSKATWNAQSRLVFQFRNGTTNVGNAVNFGNGSYGFVSGTTGSYQNINIPLSDFGNIAAATNLRITKTGTGTIGWFIDNIQLVGNNNVVQLPQIQPDWASGVTPAAILNKSVTRTVAQMQALQSASAFDPDMWYVISNPQSSFGIYRVRARDASNLEPKGTLIKAGVSYEAGYDLTNNEFTELHDNLYDNHIYQIAAQGFTALLNFPLNNNRYFGNRLINCNLTITTIGSATMQQNFLQNATITLDDNGCAGEIELNSTECFGATITLTGVAAGGSPSTLGNSEIGAGAVVNLSEGCSCNSLEIGAGISLVLVAESFSNKIINQTVSTFNKTRDISAIAGVFDFIVLGYSWTFAGVINLTSSDASESITSFDNAGQEARVTFYGQAGKTFTIVHNGADIFCNGGTDAVLTSANAFITFRFASDVAYEVARGIY